MLPGFLFLASCGDKEPQKEEKPMKPQEKAKLVYEKPAAPEHTEGQKIWMGTCKACHAFGLIGAPFIGDKQLWAPRIAQGMDTLYSHAINGFTSEMGNAMPAKGGNNELTDDQVKAAVNYMVSVSK